MKTSYSFDDLDELLAEIGTPLGLEEQITEINQIIAEFASSNKANFWQEDIVPSVRGYFGYYANSPTLALWAGREKEEYEGIIQEFCEHLSPLFGTEEWGSALPALLDGKNIDQMVRIAPKTAVLTVNFLKALRADFAEWEEMVEVKQAWLAPQALRSTQEQWIKLFNKNTLTMISQIFSGYYHPDLELQGRDYLSWHLAHEVFGFDQPTLEKQNDHPAFQLVEYILKTYFEESYDWREQARNNREYAPYFIQSFINDPLYNYLFDTTAQPNFELLRHGWIGLWEQDPELQQKMEPALNALYDSGAVLRWNRVKDRICPDLPPSTKNQDIPIAPRPVPTRKLPGEYSIMRGNNFNDYLITQFEQHGKERYNHVRNFIQQHKLPSNRIVWETLWHESTLPAEFKDYIELWAGILNRSDFRHTLQAMLNHEINETSLPSSLKIPFHALRDYLAQCQHSPLQEENPSMQKLLWKFHFFNNFEGLLQIVDRNGYTLLEQCTGILLASRLDSALGAIYQNSKVLMNTARQRILEAIRDPKMDVTKCVDGLIIKPKAVTQDEITALSIAIKNISEAEPGVLKAMMPKNIGASIS